MKFLRAALAVSCALLVATPASATYASFFGEDPNGPDQFGDVVPLASVPNSDGARTSFFSMLQSSVGTETFENRAVGSGPLAISMGNVTATLTGGSGQVVDVPVGTSVSGRYSIPSATSSKLWIANADTNSSTFEVQFSTAVAAFGFYGIDVGDNGADVQIELLLNGTVISESAAVSEKMTYTKGTNLSTDGSVFFFGFVAGANDSLFDTVRFVSRSTMLDGIGFDNFSVALRSELQCEINCGGPNPAPEPASIALVMAALLGLRSAARRKA